MDLIITLGHNSSAIGVDSGGRIFAGYEEERITRKKSESSFPTQSVLKILEVAKEQKIDSALFATCLVNPSIAKMIDEQSAEAQALGARGTPFSVVLNTKTGAQKVIPGALPIEEVQKIIASLQ